MYCTTCGVQVPAEARFCPSCGTLAQHGPAHAPIRAVDTQPPSSPFMDDELLLLSRMTEAQRTAYTMRRKDPTLALLLCFFLGGLGAHHFYLGNVLGGVLCIVFCWTLIPFLLSLVDLFLIIGRTRRYNLARAGEIVRGGPSVRAFA